MAEPPFLKLEVTESIVDVLCRRPYGLSGRELRRVMRTARLARSMNTFTRRAMLLDSLQTSQIAAGNASPVQALVLAVHESPDIDPDRHDHLFTDLGRAITAHGLVLSGPRLTTN